MAALVAALGLGSTGCLHYRADIPGVLDLRSDGRDAPPPSEPIVVEGSAARSGLDEILDGKGVTVRGNRVEVEERHSWVGVTTFAPGLFLVFNPDSRTELESALGEKGALRNVYVGHRFDVMDIAVSLGTGVVLGVCPPVAFAVSFCAPIGPHMSFVASGERVSTVPGGLPSKSPLDLDAPSVTPPATPEAGLVGDAPPAFEPAAPDAPIPAAPSVPEDDLVPAAPDAPVPDLAPVEPATGEEDK